MKVTGTGIAIALAVAIALVFLFFGTSLFTSTPVLAPIDNESPSMENSALTPFAPDQIPTQAGFTDARAGEGEVAEVGDTVSVHYVGQLPDGTVFDSSIPRGEPFTFTLGAGGVIQGWEQGLVGMKVGGTRTLVIPSELGYGAQDYGPIPGNSTLIFQVQLVNVQKGS